MDLFAFDDDYVRRLRVGDRWTEDHFVRYFELLLTLKLRGRVRPPTDIPDVIQEVFARVYNGLRGESGVREGQKLGAYVVAICNHVVLERVRATRQTEEIDNDLPATDEDAFRRIVTQQARDRVHRTLEVLGARDAEILRALFIQELDKDEIARRFEVDRNYLRVLVHRALEKFREKYETDETNSRVAPLSR
jgi:RNA polymerase sigma-70 factor (ECF subfamily)